VKAALIICLVCLVGYVSYEYVRIRNLIAISMRIVESTQPFDGSFGDRSVLVLGDSTAFGVGAKDPRESLPGRIAKLLSASVENLSKSGADVDAVAEQLSKASRGRYDMILIQAGGNDIVGIGNLEAVEERMDSVLVRAAEKTDRVVFLTAGKVGKAPLFPLSLGWVLTLRAADLRRRFSNLADRRNALYIDIYGAPDKFSEDPTRYYAADEFHPSGDGYGLWFEIVRPALEKRWPEMIQPPA
jgi:lysophospholipase L1-like esterase